ncbi:unannotated protein [freshwater metagenome]|uniref:Unannotated protein n=1 Tax=freshwater metagenome TaxID=449393 RepID=A0A6J6TYI6_9ZZZZ
MASAAARPATRAVSENTSRLAQWCFTAWNEPTLRPNCSRSPTYATVISTTRSSPPTESSAIATPARRTSSSITCWASAPANTLALGMTTSSKCTCANRRVTSVVSSRSIRTPGADESTTTNVGTAPSVAATTIHDDTCASGTNPETPLSTSDPSLRSTRAANGSSGRPDAPNNAPVAIALPSAMPGISRCCCSSSPASITAPAATTTLAIMGSGASARPISSSTTASSCHEPPEPPTDSGNVRPNQPRSAASAYRLRSMPSSVSITCRNTVVGMRSSSALRAEARSSSASSSFGPINVPLLPDGARGAGPAPVHQ